MKEMKRILVVFLTSLVLFTGCKYNDDNLWDEVKKQAERITALEEWSKTVNGNISALQALLDAQQSGDYITGVTPVKAGEVEVGYTITFSESPAITIHHGKKGEKGADGKNGADGNDGKNGADGTDGDTPDVSVKKDTDGKYYWTVNGEWLLDGSNKIPTTGIAPRIRINATSDEWEISTDGGTTWTSTDVKVTGDAIFARDGIDTTTDPNNVTFTLADGTTKITLPRTNGVTVAFDSYELLEVLGNNNEITLILPATLKESDFTAIVATVANENGMGMDIQTRGAATDKVWGVEVTNPTFEANGDIKAGSAKVTLTPPTAKGSHEAMLKVSIVNKEGQEYSVVRPIAKYIAIFDNTVAAGNGTDFRSSGAGTELSPYLITSANDLKYLVKYASIFNEKYIKLMTDIEITADVWKPIPIFKGNFDGNGKTISGRIKNDDQYCSFFGYVNSANAVIANLTVTADVESGFTNGGVYVAGIVGDAKAGEIINCHNTGTVKYTGTDMANDIHIGGIVGYLRESAKLSGCTNRGDVTIETGSTNNVFCGGIAGYAAEVKVVSCHNHGAIQAKGSGTYVNSGGIIGGFLSLKNLSGLHENINHSAVVTATGGTNNNAGGLVGNLSSGSNFYDCNEDEGNNASAIGAGGSLSPCPDSH